MSQRVVEPLRSELVDRIISRFRLRKKRIAPKDRVTVGLWVDAVAIAANGRLEDHWPGASGRSATPTEEAP